MLSKLLVDLQTALSAETALDTTTILGYPNTGRTEPTLPIVSVVFNTLTYGRHQITGAFRNRIGQTQPLGISIDVTVYVFASNEYNLLHLCDLLSNMRDSLSTVTSDGVQYSVVYGDVRRSDFAGATVEERFLAYVAECVFTLTRY